MSHSTRPQGIRINVPSCVLTSNRRPMPESNPSTAPLATEFQLPFKWTITRPILDPSFFRYRSHARSKNADPGFAVLRNTIQETSTVRIIQTNSDATTAIVSVPRRICAAYYAVEDRSSPAPIQ